MNDLARKEWEAWQVVVKEWPGDINEPRFDWLVKSLRLWGERLVELRLRQDSAIREQALRMAETAYAQAKTVHSALRNLPK